MSLTKTSKDVKKGGMIFLILAFLYYLFLLVIIPNSRNILRKMIPEKNPPNPIYGQLEPLKFTQKAITNQGPRYVLDTKNGRLPDNIPTKMVVYKLKKPQFSYLAGTEAEKNAAILGYSQTDLSSDLRGDDLTWKSLLSGGTLHVKKSTGQITAETAFHLRPDEYKAGNIDANKAKSYSKLLLTKLGRDDDTYNDKNGGTQTVTLGKIMGNSIMNTLLYSETQFARVDFYRQINKYPVYGSDPKKGLIQIYLRNPTLGNSPYNYPKLDINLHTIEDLTKEKNPDVTKIATYPIIYPDEAWAEIKKQNGVIVDVSPKDGNTLASYEPTKVETILIKEIYLAYYEPEEYVPYLQPIYVFKGIYNTKGTPGGEVMLYFPAITKEFVKAPTK
ncbi:hypothetical protein GYA27_00185 [candidate division WWE3 bacterium]|uniref:Uncharacterized protein n=1 Tax=candidate division WWE3 bacterium TaxID=2053526 RepID=A0A7X9DJG9_UNCKA|nr:hypothetical protein [candidate division WWE3 bacterium]